MKKIGFIGAGNMAFAIASGAISSGTISASSIAIFDTNKEQYKKFDSTCFICDTISELINKSDCIFLSVKPQNAKDVLNSIKSYNLSKKIIVSICAGITISSIEKILGSIKIIRVMPNTPLLIGQGVSAICFNSIVNEDDLSYVNKIFASSGTVINVNESDMNNITAITGSSPAYVYLFIKSICDAARSLGFDSECTKDIVCKTFIGASNMVLTSEKTLDDLISMVKSPNGTTEKALNVFSERNLDSIIFDAMNACSKRAEELSRLN